MKRLILFLVVLSVPYNASAEPINTGAEVLTSITVPEQFSFDIGQFLVAVPGGELDFDAGEITSLASNFTLVSGNNLARWVSASAPAFTTITVTVASTGTTQASGDETLVIISHCRGSDSALDAENCTFSSAEVIGDDATMDDKASQHNPPAAEY